ncbi:potassium channel family protein [Stenotrophomonas beteli]|nr:potassium channel family protein [Stenotrophomonas maltophilia]
MSPTQSPGIGQPHSKPYMPGRIGRTLERASYRDMWIVSVFVLLASTIYFATAPEGHGIEQAGAQKSDLLDAAYFSVVTLTSLGYGDYLPVGVGRIVTCGLVFFGLAAVALFIGKLASERSQATLFLLHTSDRDRRLSDFSAAMAGVREKLCISIDNANVNDVSRLVQDLNGKLEGVSNYVAFHAHHSSLGVYGNAPALNRMLIELKALSRPIVGAMSLPAIDTESQRRLDVAVGRIVSLVKLVIEMQSNRVLDWTGTVLTRIGFAKATTDISNAQRKLENGLLAEIELGRRKAATVITEAVLAQVLSACPAGPLQNWPRHDHKRIAVELRLSNKFVTRAIEKLRVLGRLPKAK